jgi:hypothetical protein
LENNAKKWERDYQRIQAENKQLREYADAQRWETDLKRLQQENQSLREFSGPTDMADLRREYAKIKSDLKDAELKNVKLNGEIKRLKFDKEKHIKSKQVWSFKSL